MTTFMTPVEVISPTEPPSPSPTTRTPLDTLSNNAGQKQSSRHTSALQDVEQHNDAPCPNPDSTPPSPPRHRAQTEAELPTWTPLAVTDRMQVDDADGNDALPTSDALPLNKATVRNALQEKMHRVASESLTHTTPPRTRASAAEEKQSVEAIRAERAGGMSQQDTHVDELDLFAENSPPAPVHPRHQVMYGLQTNQQRTLQSLFPLQSKTASTTASMSTTAPAHAQQTITDSLVALFNKQTLQPVPKSKDASTSERAPRPRPSFPHPVQETCPAQSPTLPGPARTATKPKPRSALVFDGIELPTLQSIRAASKTAQPTPVPQRKRQRSPTPSSSSYVSDSQSRSRQSSSRTSDPANAAAESLADAIARVYAEYSTSPVKHPTLDAVKVGTAAQPAAKRQRLHPTVESAASVAETPIDVDVDDIPFHADTVRVGPPARPTANRRGPRPVIETPGSVPETSIETDDDDRPLVSFSEEHPPADDQRPKPQTLPAPSGGGLLSVLNATFNVNKDKAAATAFYPQLHTRPQPVVLLQRRERPHLGEKESIAPPPRRRRPPREFVLSTRQADALLGTKPLPLELALPPGTFTHHDAEGEVVEVVGWWEGDELEERVKMDVRVMLRRKADHTTRTRGENTGNTGTPRPVMQDEKSRVLAWVDRLEGLFGPGDVARGDRNFPHRPKQHKKPRHRRVVVRTDSNESSRYGSARRDMDSRAASTEDNDRPRKRPRSLDVTDAFTVDVPDEDTILSWTGALQKLAKGKTAMDREAMLSLSGVLTLVDATKDSVSPEVLVTTRLAQSMTLVGTLDEIPFGDEHGLKERAAEVMQHWAAKFPNHFPLQL